MPTDLYSIIISIIIANSILVGFIIKEYMNDDEKHENEKDSR
jgi:hypothetical protein